MTQQQQELIDEIMDCFDFKRVAEVMRKLNWSWASCTGTPEDFEIRRIARGLLKKALVYDYCATGGLCASYNDGELRLAFEVTNWGVYVDDKGNVVSS